MNMTKIKNGDEKKMCKKMTYSEKNPLIFCIVCHKGMYHNRDPKSVVYQAQMLHFKNCEKSYGSYDGYMSAQRMHKMDIIEFNKKLREHQQKNFRVNE